MSPLRFAMVRGPWMCTPRSPSFAITSFRLVSRVMTTTTPRPTNVLSPPNGPMAGGRPPSSRKSSAHLHPFVTLSLSHRPQHHTTVTGGWIVATFGILGGVVSAVLMSRAEEEERPSEPNNTPTPDPVGRLRTQSFPLTDHHHGKTRVRLLKVDRTPLASSSHRSSSITTPSTSHSPHVVQEYTVATTVFCPHTARCFTEGDNHQIVATDTQKNMVYVVAKLHRFDTPEELALLVAQALLQQYPWLQAVQVEVDQTPWQRYCDQQGQNHPHGFLQTSPEHQQAVVFWDRRWPTPTITSSLTGMTVLKTTQSGFEGYHLDDPYTLLPPTRERCLATQIQATWTYQPPLSVEPATTTTTSPTMDDAAPALPGPADYQTIRTRVRELLQQGFFGPSATGVYSPSLQATVYDAACLIMTELGHSHVDHHRHDGQSPVLPALASIRIETPNLHYLPAAPLLTRMGLTFEHDVYIPTNEPSGMISCTVSSAAEVVDTPENHSHAQHPVV